MKQVLQIAFKNTWEHKAKSLIMILLIAIGVGILLTGNSIFYTSEKFLHNTFIENYTGDIMITGIMQKKNYEATLFGEYTRGPSVSFGENNMPYIPQKEKIETKLNSIPEVKTYANSAFGIGLTSYDGIPDDWEASGDHSFFKILTLLLGIDSANYWKTFDSIEIIEGSIPENSDTPFILLDSENFPQNFEKYYERPLKVNDQILIKNLSMSSGSAVSVRVAGFFKVKRGREIDGRIAYMDITSLRTLMGMTAGANVAQEIPDSIDLSLSNQSEDDLFSDSFDNSFAIEEFNTESNFTMTSVDSILGDTTLRDKLNMPDEDAWHHITIKLQNSKDTDKIIQELTTWFKDEGIEAKAVNWVNAAQQYTDAIFIFKQAFNIILIIFAVVLFLVIMNALIVSVIERTKEIGTMRAIGASKGFVRSLFLFETLFLSIIGVAGGIILSTGIVTLLNALNIAITNDTLKQLLGKSFYVSMDYMSALWSFIMVLIAGFLANMYPMWLALRISPLKAMQSN